MATNIMDKRKSKQRTVGLLSFLTGGLYGMIRHIITGEDVFNDDGTGEQAMADYLKENDPEGYNAYMESIGQDLDESDYARNALLKETGAGLTDADKEANAFNRQERLESQEFNAEEAQKSRDFTMYMAQNKYGMETSSMLRSGLNPAMVYGGGNLVSTAANGAQASISPAHSVNPSSAPIGGIINALMAVARMPLEAKRVQAEMKAADADLMNARTNWYNANTGRYNADTERIKADISCAMTQSNIAVNEAEIEKITQETVNLKKQFDQMDDYLDIAKQNANSNERQAFAALENALARSREVAIKENMSVYEIQLLKADASLKWMQGEGQAVVNRYLPAEYRAKINELYSKIRYNNGRVELFDEEGKLMTAQETETYLRSFAELLGALAGAVGSFVHP